MAHGRQATRCATHHRPALAVAALDEARRMDFNTPADSRGSRVGQTIGMAAQPGLHAPACDANAVVTPLQLTKARAGRQRPSP